MDLKSKLMVIYLVTNKINGKMYVGQTKYTASIRWSQHKNAALIQKINTPFYKAIRKYGAEAFEIKILDTASSREELNKKEISTILNLRKTNILYNLTTDGFTVSRKWTEEEKKTRSKPPVEKQQIVCLNNKTTYSSIREAGKILNLKETSISSVLVGRKNAVKGFVFEYTDEQKRQKSILLKELRSLKLKENHYLGRKVVDLSTGTVFESIKKAAKHYKVSPSSIGRFLKDGWGKCHNLNLRYLEA